MVVANPGTSAPSLRGFLMLSAHAWCDAAEVGGTAAERLGQDQVLWSLTGEGTEAGTGTAIKGSTSHSFTL